MHRFVWFLERALLKKNFTCICKQKNPTSNRQQNKPKETYQPNKTPQNHQTNHKAHQNQTKKNRRKKEKHHNKNLVAFLSHLHPSICKDTWYRAAFPVLFWFSPLWVTGKVRRKVDPTGEEKSIWQKMQARGKSLEEMCLSEYFLICY